MKVQIVNLKKASSESRIIDLEGNRDNVVDDGIIEPIFTGYEPYFVKRNSELFAQCIDAITQSVCGYGYTLTMNGEPASESSQLQDTLEMIENINPAKPFIEVVKQNVNDLLLFGYSGTEVMLSEDETEFELSNIPVHELRLCVKDNNYTEYEIDGITKRWRFRRYAQVKGADKVFFKELYDPRIIDYMTGKEATDDTKDANPLLWIDNGNITDNAYPEVLWSSIGYAALSIGKVHELNYKYFDSGRIQTKVLLVNGGDLSEEDAEEISELLSNSKGIDSAGNIIVIQSPPSTIETGGGLDEKVSPVKMELVDLAPQQQKDPQYLEFINDCRKSIMSAFRVPPIVLGYSGDYNRATSEEAKEVFYTKVVMPYQEKLENAYNKLLSFTGNSYRIKFNNPYRQDFDTDDEQEQTEEEEKGLFKKLFGGKKNENK